MNIPHHLTAVPPSPAPVLANPGFEAGLAEWTVQICAGGTAEAVTTASALGHLGLRLRGDAAAKPFGIANTPVAITAGHHYAVTFWARRAGRNPGITVRLGFTGPDGALIVPVAPTKGPTVARVRRDLWFDKYTLTVIAPMRAQFLTVHIEAEAGTDLAADFDDFSLTDIRDDAVAAAPAELESWLAAARQHLAAGFEPPAVVLKLDDLQLHQGTAHPRWDRVADFLAQRRIKASIGIIGRSLEPDEPTFRRWILERRKAGLLEFWHHGYDHREWKENGRTMREFDGTSLDHQQRHLHDTSRLAREKLGFPFTVFGAPFNATDDATVVALLEEPDIKVWLYGDPEKPAGKIVLGRAYAVDLEHPVLVPNFAHFVEGWAHNPRQRYLVLQGHPLGWNDVEFTEFAQIIDFLVSQKARFVFAAELATELEAQTHPPPTVAAGK